MLEQIFYGTGFGRDRMSLARGGYLLLIWVLLPTWLVTVYFNLLVGLSFTAAFSMFGDRMGTETSFRNPHLSWTGDISIDDLRVRSVQGGGGEPISLDVRRISIDMPNWGVMQNVLAAAGDDGDGDGEAQVGMLKVVDRMDHVGLQVEGMRFDSIGGLPGVLANVGMASAAPLEAEGCQGDVLWVASELPKLGIDNQGIDLQLTLANAAEAHEVRVTGKLVSPHSSRAEFAQHFRAPSMSAFLDAPEGSRIATYERVAIDDDGFIAARDAYCAKRDGVSPEDFRERHIAAARRLLEEGGMLPTPALEAVYRRYLEKGQLVLEARPSGTIRREDYHHYALADQVRMYNGTLAAGSTPLPLQFEEVPTRAIPQNFNGSTWDLVAVESRPPAEATNVASAASVARPVPVATVPPAPMPGPQAVPVTPVASRPPAASAPAAAAKVAAATAPAWAVPPTTSRTTVDGRPLASSLPQANAARLAATSLDFSELSRHLGERLEITTIFGERHTGRLESVRGTSLQLRMSIAVGYAITNFERGNIRQIRDLD